MKGVRTAGNPHAIFRPLGLGKPLLKLSHMLPQDKPRIPDNIRNPIIHLVIDLVMLRLQIHEGDLSNRIKFTRIPLFQKFSRAQCGYFGLNVILRISRNNVIHSHLFSTGHLDIILKIRVIAFQSA